MCDEMTHLFFIFIFLNCDYVDIITVMYTGRICQYKVRQVCMALNCNRFVIVNTATLNT